MPTVSDIKRIVKRAAVVYTVSPETAVSAAAAVMTRHDVGCLVVIGDGDAILGIVTERDILRNVVAKSADPTSVPVSKMMTQPVVVCTTGTSGHQAEKMMAHHGTRHLPILENGQLVGMISSRDIMAAELSAARYLVRKQSEILQDLETTHPGITRLETDLRGRIMI